MLLYKRMWTFATPIDGMLESSQEQFATLLEARPKPHALDDYTVNRVIEAFRRPLQFKTCFNTQNTQETPNSVVSGIGFIRVQVQHIVCMKVEEKAREISLRLLPIDANFPVAIVIKIFDQLLMEA